MPHAEPLKMALDHDDSYEQNEIRMYLNGNRIAIQFLFCFVFDEFYLNSVFNVDNRITQHCVMGARMEKSSKKGRPNDLP